MRKRVFLNKIEYLFTDEGLYFLSYVVFLSMAILNTTMFSQYTYRFANLVYAGCLGLLMFRELTYGRYSVKTLTLILGGFVLSVLAVLFAHAAVFPMTIVFIVMAGRIAVRKVLKVALVTTIILCAITILAAEIGLIQNIIYYQGVRVRYALGFRYVLCLPTYFFNIAAIICYLQKERIKYSTLAILTILSTIIFVQTNSRLTYMTTILLVFFMVYEKLLERFLPQFKKMNPIWALFIPIFLVISVFSVYITICYDPSIGWHNLLNRFLGDRLVISNRSYNIYGIPLLGNSSIEWVGQSVDVNGIKPSGAITYVDNLFFNILQQYGIVTLFAVVILCTIMMYRCYQLGDRILMMILVILALHAFFDGIIQQLQYNSFLHFIYYLCARYAYMESERSKEEQERRKLLSTGYLNNGLWSRIRKRCLAGAAAYIRRKPADGMIKKE